MPADCPEHQAAAAEYPSDAEAATTAAIDAEFAAVAAAQCHLAWFLKKQKIFPVTFVRVEPVCLPTTTKR